MEDPDAQQPHHAYKVTNGSSKAESVERKPSYGANGKLMRTRSYSDKSLSASLSGSYHPDSDRIQSPAEQTVHFGPLLPVILCILFTELCERLTYYGISGNLLVFLNTDLNVSSALASSIVLIFTGVSFVVPVFGGWLADSIAGKYNTLYGSVLIYFVGAALLTTVAFKFQDKLGYAISDVARFVYFGLALVFVSIGTGGIKANVSPFGAEQVQKLGQSAISVFFNWFYWFINLGSFIAYTLVVYVQVEYSFFSGYLIPTGAIFLAMLILISGRKKYICSPPNGSVITDICKIMYGAMKRKWRLWRAGTKPNDKDMCWLDYGRVKYGGKFTNGQVDTVLSLLRILPIFGAMILYWTIYFQMQTSYLLQGLNMKLRIGTFNIPAASLSLFDVVIILMLIPLMDRVVYRVLRKLHIDLTPLKRIGIGMVFAILSVIVAGVIEVYRRDHVKDGKRVEISGKYYNQSSITVFYQGPQYVLIGISEVFASISGLEFAYAQSPRVLQGMVMGLFLLTSGLGSLLGSVLIQIVKSASLRYGGQNWYSDDVNEGKLDYFFYLLAILLGVNFLVFCVISMRYTYVSDSVLRRNEKEWKRQNERQDDDLESESHGYITRTDLLDT